MTAERWARITGVFRLAMEKPPGERTAFVWQACGGDETLRRDVERLLAGAAAPSLESPLPEFLESGGLELVPGEALAQYHVESKIGEGGMGAVYRSYDTRLQRIVALKVLPPERFADLQRKRRLIREARAASALNHPNIVTIYEIGSDRGVDFIAMEFVDGKGLDEVIPRGGLPAARLLRYAVQIADALATAHAAGVLHRDLKPTNIMVTTDGRIKLLDFGLAKLLPAPHIPPGAEAATGGLTEEGAVVGTPAYMSPEQAEGRKLDARSDVFSFGSVLYEMATGLRPFIADSRVALLSVIVQDDPRPPGAVGPLAPELEKLILRCLQKEPARRYQAMPELKAALEDLEAEASRRNAHAPERERLPSADAPALSSRAAAGPVSAAALPHPRISRHALWMIPLLAMALAAALVHRLDRTGQAIDTLAVLPFTNVGGDPKTEYLSDGIAEHLINSLSQSPTVRVTARSLAFRYKGPQFDPQTAGRALRVRAVLTGRVSERDGAINVQAELMRVDDGAQLWGRQYTGSLSDILSLQQDIAQQVSAKVDPEATVERQKRLARRPTADPDAYQAYLKGRYYWNRRSEQALKRAVEYFQQAIDKDPGYALAYAGLADCYALYNSYQVELPRESGPKARAAAVRALEIDDTLAQAHASLGMTQMSYEWDWAGAEREFRRAIGLDPNYATAYHWNGICLAATGRTSEALASLQRAQQLDPLSLIINADIGLVLHFGRRDLEAVEQVRKVLEMDPTFAAGHRHLGMAYEQQSMYAEAITEFQKGLEVAKGNPFTLGSLGHAYAISGGRAKARQTLSAVLEMSGRRYVSPFAAALIYAGLGEQEHALEWLEKALKDRSLDMIFLKVDPRFDRLHADPRFAALLRRMGLSM